jgi:histidine kinase
MLRARRHRRILLVLLSILGGALLVMALAYHWAGTRAQRAETAQLDRQLDLHAQALQQRIDRYRTLPQVLAQDPDLRDALAGPVDDARRNALNQRLEDANSVTRSSTLTLIDRRGIAVAASNWREPTSNVGEDYSFRPYVKQALRTGRGQFYGIGLTTGEPGYFLSQAISGPDGKVAGLVVIKIELDALEQEWLQTPDIVLVSDAHGVIFLASRDGWRYRTLNALSDADRRELAATRQYARQRLTPLQSQDLSTTDAGARRVQFTDPALAGAVLWQSMALPEEGWHLHLLHDASAITAAGRTAALAAGGGWLALAFLALFMQQRRRTALLQQRSRDELEAVLQQHAQELRTAQDGIVEAARQADAGLSRSLEHLPQGVVIIDADLRLVAWNSRYMELFRFPPDLIHVGRPIEDVFRHNARRGLLGPGPVEEAIQRRLDHLRSGKPHMRESEKDDGVVLEIRGNPLPDGGFVTSYADITSYKNAARELRSLADALERRVEERTRALAAATQAAENANRYKTRFVASAVHDLLQPLNAARMFVSALRGRLHDDEARRIADHVDNALTAQDAILNSLLDIARLESGTLPARVRDFPLAPLLETLAREFGMVAGERGLTLACIPTSSIVRSDEALLRRILQNFLSNAIRYTPRGRVLLGVRRRGGQVRIEVHDQGPGIPESLQAEIF